jgi:hypothetical protein
MSLVRIFNLLGMVINRKPGKTECILRYRGKGATAALERTRGNGKLVIKIPGVSDQVLHVVQHYKHLGGIISADGSLHKDAKHKVDAGMTAYSPIAMKVCGSPHMGTWLKLQFCDSLLMSRLCFNAHIVVPTPRYLTMLNQPYMRVLRRIAGHVRFSSGAIPDYQVRTLLAQPSIDCYLMKARLNYLKRVIRNNPRSLTAILHLRVNGRRLQWSEQITRDINDLRLRVSLCHGMPSPDEDASVWIDFISSEGDEWQQALAQLSFTESVCDATVEASVIQPLAHQCVLCGDGRLDKPSFPTEKALKMHMRVVHKIRNIIRLYVDEAGVCPICKTDFKTRLRCIAHLSDVRRPRCREQLLSGSHPLLTSSRLQELDEKDRMSRRSARREGHTHPLAVEAARTVSGKRVGRVQQ